MIGINLDLLQWSINFLIKKTSATHARSEALATQNKFVGSGIKNENISNQELAEEELHKPINRKFKKTKCTHFLYTIFGVLILLICNNKKM